MATVAIPLPGGVSMLVDEEDAPLFEGVRLRVDRGFHTSYAIAILEPKPVQVANLILPPPPGCVVDHKDHDGLNNTRGNLRIATPLQNAWNRRKSRLYRKQYVGVYRSKHNTYIAEIVHIGKRIYLGSHKTAEEAARAYDRKALELRGEFAVTNFPREGYDRCPETRCTPR